MKTRKYIFKHGAIMKTYSYPTKEEKQFSCFMRFCGALFTSAFLLLIIAQFSAIKPYIENITSLSAILTLTGFWSLFAAGEMLVFAVLSFMAAFDVRLYRNTVLAIIITKMFLVIATFIVLAVSFFSKQYLLIFLVDIPLFLLMAFFYTKL